MSQMFLNRRWLVLVCVASLAFNAGVGATVGVRTYRRLVGPGREFQGKPQGESPGEARGWGRRGDRGARGEYGRGQRESRLHQALGLSQDQAESLRLARKTMFENVGALRGVLRDENRALSDLIAAPKPDRVAIDAQLGRIASLRAEIDLRVVEHFLGIKEILEPEQHEAFNEVVHRAFNRDFSAGHGSRGRSGIRGRGGPQHFRDVGGVAPDGQLKDKETEQ